MESPQTPEIPQKDLELAKKLRTDFLTLKKLFLKATEDKDQELRLSLYNKAEKLTKRIKSLERGDGDITTQESIQTKYTNPKGQTETIEINIETQIQEQLNFYKDEDIDTPPDFKQQIRDLWNNNQDKIIESIEQQGFDHILIIPPYNTEDLNQKTTKDYTETKEWIPISEIKDTKPNQTRIILVHKDRAQNLERPELAQTKNKSIYDLCNATTEQEKQNINNLLENNQPLPIDGLTFAEYLIYDRQYFKETGKHLDEKTSTWLPQSTKDSSVVSSRWFSVDSRVDVFALSPGDSDSLRGLRSSRTIL